LLDHRFIRRHDDADAHGLIERYNNVQRFPIHKAKQQSARVRLVVCIGSDTLAASDYRQNGAHANPALEHALDGVPAEDHLFTFH
jgi:hypothetical protein